MHRPQVVFFYQHFWPDSPPYANLLRVIGSGLVTAGFAVDMLTAQPSYKASDRRTTQRSKDDVDRIAVTRLSLLPGSRRLGAVRLAGKALFPLRALCVLVARRLRGRRADVVVAATIPPVLNGLCALVGARLTGARFVYHLQDIYPEVGAAGGLWPERSLRHRLLRHLDGFISRRADRCVVLSEDMHVSLVARGVASERVVIINNFLLSSFATSDAAEPVNSNDVAATTAPGRRRIVFAGNLGRFQALDALLSGFLLHVEQSNSLELHFLGEGAIKEQLVSRAGASPHVHFHGHVDFDIAARFIENCDAGIVSIGEGVHRYAYPSKTLSYLGLGIPLLVCVEENSSLAEEVRTFELGVVCGERTPEAVARAFAELATWLDERPAPHESIANFVEQHVSADAAVDRWSSMIASVVAPGAAVSPSASRSTTATSGKTE